MENDHSAATSVQRNTLGASGASGNDDLNIVTRLIEELTSTLQDSHRAVDELCKLADGVTLNGNSTESRNDTDAETDADIEADNLRLWNEIRHKRTRNILTGKLLKLCIGLLDRCAQLLRQFCYERTFAVLKLHSQYTKELDEKRLQYDEVLVRGAQLEQRVFALSRALAQVVSSASDYGENITTSVDFHFGKQTAVEARSTGE